MILPVRHPRMLQHLLQAQPVGRIEPEHPLQQVHRVAAQPRPPFREHVAQVSRGHEAKVLVGGGGGLLPGGEAGEHHEEDDAGRPEVDGGFTIVSPRMPFPNAKDQQTFPMQTNLAQQQHP